MDQNLMRRRRARAVAISDQVEVRRTILLSKSLMVIVSGFALIEAALTLHRLLAAH